MLAFFKKISVVGILLLSLAGCRAAATPPPPADPLSDASWDDRSIFRAGLVSSAQPALEQLPGASIYHLDVELAADLASLSGSEHVRYTNQEDTPLEAVYFQLFPNMAGGKSSISALSVDGVPIQPVYEEHNSTLRVSLAAPLQPGQRAVIRLDFQVDIPAGSGGNYSLFGYRQDVLALDGFYPAIPVYDAHGWHKGSLPPFADTTFQDASFYVVRVKAPAALKFAASGVQVSQSAAGGSQIITFAAGPARDFYMAASRNFEAISEKAGETTLNSYALPGSAAGAQTALRTALNALKSFDRRLGDYPYTEFDLVSIPMQGGTGIEYPGITGINLAVYAPGATVNGLPASVLLESTVAHEVGHQWFYNVVGNDQINEPWVDESLTQYLTGLYFLDQYGQRGWADYRSSWASRWERVNRADIPIGLPAGDYKGKEYGAIVYGRGPLFIEALAQKLGQASFDSFLRDYYSSQLWGIASAASFKQLARKHCGCDLTPLFVEWVNPK